MKCFFKSKKGFSLIEALLAITLLGIIAIPLFSSLTNCLVLTKHTQEQIEINAVEKIIKEYITDKVKNHESAVYTRQAVTDKSGALYQQYANYNYDSTNITFGDLKFPNSKKYKIILKTSGDIVLKEFYLIINTLPQGVT